eukprot:scaffold12093_cov137-Isochrysis_galbana.AAC.2
MWPHAAVVVWHAPLSSALVTPSWRGWPVLADWMPEPKPALGDAVCQWARTVSVSVVVVLYVAVCRVLSSVVSEYRALPCGRRQLYVCEEPLHSDFCVRCVHAPCLGGCAAWFCDLWALRMWRARARVH